MRGYEAPAITKKSFSCPICGAHTGQTWYGMYAQEKDNGELPHVFTREVYNDLISRVQRDSGRDSEDFESVEKVFKDLLDSIDKNLPNLERLSDTTYCRFKINNLFVSKCYVCKEITLWFEDKIIHPIIDTDIHKPEDLPIEAVKVFDEAASILKQSPRAAAALLRLCVQIICEKICTELGVYKKGMSIDDMIQEMYKRGLPERLRSALDIVRIKGNEAVHEIVLTDTMETARGLFGVINTICIQMITSVRAEKEMYDSLPDPAKKAIEKKRPLTTSDPIAIAETPPSDSQGK